MHQVHKTTVIVAIGKTADVWFIKCERANSRYPLSSREIERKKMKEEKERDVVLTNKSIEQWA
jgi:hypothetical protein